MATYVLPKFNQVLSMINESIAEFEQFAEYQQNVLRNVLWNGQWIDRGWIPNNYSSDGEWVGSLHDDNRIFLFPQIWALLSNTLNTTETKILLNSVNKYLREYPNSIGSIDVNPPYPQRAANGTWTNGGIWYAQNHPLVIALSRLNSSMAFNEWQRNSFAYRANMYPKFWPGIWSSSDSTVSYMVNNTKQSAIGTSSQPKFPILCTHAHSWPLYSLSTGLVGITFEMNSIKIQPAFPQTYQNKFGSFQFISKLVTVFRDNDGNYNGSYAPIQFVKDTFDIIIDLRIEKDKIDDDKWIFTKTIQLKPHRTNFQTTIIWTWDIMSKSLLVNDEYQL
eukprot:279618_1